MAPHWWVKGGARPPVGRGICSSKAIFSLFYLIEHCQISKRLSDIYQFHCTAGQGHRSKTRSRGHEVKSFQIRKFEIAKKLSILCCVDISKDF